MFHDPLSMIHENFMTNLSIRARSKIDLLMCQMNQGVNKIHQLQLTETVDSLQCFMSKPFAKSFELK